MTDALPDEVEACDFLTLPNSQRRDKRRAQKPEYKNRKRSRDKALKSTVEYKTIKNAHAVEQRKNSESELCTNVAILDMETDPFDAESNAEIAPFCACIFWIDQTTGIEHEHVFWNDDSHALIKELYSFIEAMPGRFTIYAHNGGRFDYLFMLHRLRGRMLFKGRALMSAKIGLHELRDSFHIIPTSLSEIQKDNFDYSKMHRKKRHQYRDDIIAYLKSDCRYLYPVIKSFIDTYGRKISIGQAAQTELKKSYAYKKLSESMDGYIRPFFFGGRVECLRGAGHWENKPFKLYDVNSMYPSVMANYLHPIGDEYRIRTDGKIRDNTCFIELYCESNGAFLKRQDDGSVQATIGYDRFFVTVHAFNVATRHDIIRNVNIIRTLDCKDRTNFAAFVVPLYDRRETLKRKLKSLAKGSEEYNVTFRESLFLKLLLNNAYGKFAQNPRRFKEVVFTEPGVDYPEETIPKKDELNLEQRNFWGIQNPLTKSGFGPNVDAGDYWIWERPNQRVAGLFNNVATGASITGAARAVLLDALCRSKNPYYCDTDSIICTDLDGVEIDASKLGAWDCEMEFDELLIAGKKTYACLKSKQTLKMRSKGVSTLTCDQLRIIVAGNPVSAFASKAPLIRRDGEQMYISRIIRATAFREIELHGIAALRATGDFNEFRTCAA